VTDVTTGASDGEEGVAGANDVPPKMAAREGMREGGVEGGGGGMNDGGGGAANACGGGGVNEGGGGTEGGEA
jgi:hypothetical protein